MKLQKVQDAKREVNYNGLLGVSIIQKLFNMISISQKIHNFFNFVLICKFIRNICTSTSSDVYLEALLSPVVPSSDMLPHTSANTQKLNL
jgi:hypothetical protein